MSNAAPKLAFGARCLFCDNIVTVTKMSRNKKFCDVRCSNGFHNEMKRQKMQRLKEIHPEVYREVFKCSAIEG